MPQSNNASELLKNLLETLEVSKVLSAPFDESIEGLLKASSRALGAEGASVLLPEGDSGDLRFVWASGKVADSLIGVTIPSGKGIAGFVFSTGQPMAVSDAESESSFYPEVDRNTGFSTHSVLATPLQFEGNITGVLEYVNRKGSPPYEPFTAEEMDLAALHAEAIASLVHAYNAADLAGALVRKIIDENGMLEPEQASKFIEEAAGSETHRELMELALLIREVARTGDREKQLCREILETVLRYGSPAPGS